MASFALNASVATNLAARSRVSPNARQLSSSSASSSSSSSAAAAVRRRRCCGARASGDGGLDTTGIPFLIARGAGFDTREGLAGFTPFAELFVGRTAMGGFATGLLTEVLTGNGILAQIGWDTPNPATFDVLVTFLLGSTVAGTLVTLQQLVSGEMSVKQFKRYQALFGQSAEDEATAVSAARKAKEDAEGAGYIATEFAAMQSSSPAAVVNSMDEPEVVLTPKQVNDVTLDYLKTVEMNNGRWAMIGFAVAIVMEAKTGGGMIPQLITYGKMTGLLGPDSGF